MGMTWDIDNGLREMTPSENDAEGRRHVKKAKRCGRKQRDERDEEMAKAADFFRDADEARRAGDDEDDENTDQRDGERYIEGCTDPSRRAYAVDQYHRQYGPLPEKLAKLVADQAAKEAEDKPIQRFSSYDRLADGVDPDRLGG